MPGTNNAAGAQPGPLPRIVHLPPAPDHYAAVPVGSRPRPKTKIVLHDTVGTDSRAWLSTTSRPPVSIHVLIARDGTRYNIVNYQDVAWHVGNARAGYWNSNCLGVEFESTNDKGRPVVPYTAAQYATGGHLLATWLYSYGLAWAADVVRHGDIALPAGRRHDPWGLDVPRLHAGAGAWLAFFYAVPAVERGRYII